MPLRPPALGRGYLFSRRSSACCALVAELRPPIRDDDSQVTIESQQQDELLVAGAAAVFLSATLRNWRSEWLQRVLEPAMLLGFKQAFVTDAEDIALVEQEVVREPLWFPASNPGEHHIIGTRASEDSS